MFRKKYDNICFWLRGHLQFINFAFKNLHLGPIVAITPITQQLKWPLKRTPIKIMKMWECHKPSQKSSFFHRIFTGGKAMETIPIPFPVRRLVHDIVSTTLFQLLQIMNHCFNHCFNHCSDHCFKHCFRHCFHHCFDHLPVRLWPGASSVQCRRVSGPWVKPGLVIHHRQEEI